MKVSKKISYVIEFDEEERAWLKNLAGLQSYLCVKEPDRHPEPLDAKLKKLIETIGDNL